MSKAAVIESSIYPSHTTSHSGNSTSSCFAFVKGIESGNFSGLCSFSLCGECNFCGFQLLSAIKSLAVSNIASPISPYSLGPQVAPNGNLVSKYARLFNVMIVSTAWEGNT